MYTLILTSNERAAIDWIGLGHTHGDELFRLLSSAIMSTNWDNDCDITFTISENAAWEIKSLCEPNNYALDCFGPDLRSKLIDFCSKIV